MIPEDGMSCRICQDLACEVHIIALLQICFIYTFPQGNLHHWRDCKFKNKIFNIKILNQILVNLILLTLSLLSAFCSRVKMSLFCLENAPISL